MFHKAFMHDLAKTIRNGCHNLCYLIVLSNVKDLKYAILEHTLENADSIRFLVIKFWHFKKYPNCLQSYSDLSTSDEALLYKII